MRRPSKRPRAQGRPHLQVEELDPQSLHPYAHNARSHSPRQLQQLAASITCFGFVTPALINATGDIIAGHARIEAAKAIGLNRIPCIRVGRPQRGLSLGTTIVRHLHDVAVLEVT
jgi:hypothetical protein